MSLSGDIKAGHLKIGGWSAERQPGRDGVHPYRWGAKMDGGHLVRGVVVHDRKDGALSLAAKVLAAAARELGGRDHAEVPTADSPDQAVGSPKGASKSDSLPTAEAIADALIRYETGGCCGFGWTCGLCDCGRGDATPEQLETANAMDLDRARAVLALIPPQRCTPSEDEVQRVVEAHQPTLRIDSRVNRVECTCGAWLPCDFLGMGYVDLKSEARTRGDHLAAAILALFGDQPTVAQAKAEALREAADEIAAVAKRIRDAHDGAPSDVVGHILGGYGQAEGVIRDRAAAIESGAEHD